MVRRRPDTTAVGRVAAVLASLLAAACVTHDVEPEAPSLDVDTVRPVTVATLGPTEDAEGRAVSAWYRDVESQMRDALSSRDLIYLRALLEQHDRPAAPDWFREQIDLYRRMAAALELELHVEQVAAIETRTPDAAIGEPVVFELQVESTTRSDVVLPGAGGQISPERFLVTVTVSDYGCYGDHTVRRSAELVTLGETVALGRGEPLRQPFALPELAPEGCLRRVTVAVDWLPGNVILESGALPHGRVKLQARSFEFYPRGIESVRQNPYSTLRSALESGDPAHFDHVFLAARFMPDDFREDALRKLVQHLRVGPPDQARVCTAALAVLTGADLPLGDRDGWLAWWSRRTDAR